MEIPSLVEAARQVRTVECSAAELFAEYLSSIERDNPVMNALVHVDATRAFALAAKIDTAVRERRIDELRPLASAPFGVKEIDDCAGMPTTRG